MDLRPESSKALTKWLGPSTRHSEHHTDWNHWYDFVNQYQREHGNSLDEAALREHIARQVGWDGDEQISQIIGKRISTMYRILDFLARTQR
jgi:hypothetical protein